MAATNLLQYWTDEVTRVGNRQAALKTEIAAARTALGQAQARRSLASDAVAAQTAALDAARKALAGIPMPGDGDPLLQAMEDALVGLADARAALAAADADGQRANAEWQRLLGRQTALDVALADASREQAQAEQAAAERKAWADALTVGDLATLAADASQALTDFEADARTRVEGGFPTNAAAAKHFLKRARARRALVADGQTASADTEDAAFAAASNALEQARRTFDRCAAAVRAAAHAAPVLEADRAALARLAALPAANAPNSYPIVTRWQHDRLHDTTKKVARETALAKLTDVDAATTAVRSAQKAYDLALHAAMKAQPDLSQAALDTGPVAAEKTTLTGKQGDLATASAAMTAGESATVKAWFATVPEPLWDALDRLDLAVARLKSLAGPPAPAALLANLGAAEAALATALEADRLAQRKADAAQQAGLRAAGALAADRETATSRAQAVQRSAGAA